MADGLLEVNTQVGVSRTVATTEVASGSFKLASSTTRTGERSTMPGRRQVSCGLSDSTVPMPTRMASLAARIWNTRVRAASPVIAAGLRPAKPALPSADTASLSVTYGRPFGDAHDVAGMHAARLVGAEADIDRDAFVAQPLMALAGDFRIGVFQRRHHARDAGLDDGVGARRRLALMRARLERHVHRGALRRLLGAAQRLDLGMRAAAGLRPAAADDDAILDDHRADRRIGPGVAEPAPAERERQRHEARVVRGVRRAAGIAIGSA